jgi:hypothetical protein
MGGLIPVSVSWFPNFLPRGVVVKEKRLNRKLQKAELDAALGKALVEASHKSYLQLAREFGVSANYVVGIALNMKTARRSWNI